MRIFTLLVALIVLFSTAFYAQIIPRDGLVAYYKFDDGSGTLVSDSSDNGLTGEIVGGAEWSDGFVGGALLFNGTDSYVNCGNSPDFDMEFEITLIAWVYPYDLMDNMHDPWLSKGDHTYAIKNHSDSNSFEFFINDGDWHAVRIDRTEDDNEVWHQYAGTYDGIQLVSYIDGVPLDTLELESFINVNTTEFWMGANSEEGGRFFEGKLDEALVYNRALSAEEIAALYDSYFVSSAVGEKPVGILKDYVLEQNYPNPFNPSTIIQYQLPKISHVELSIFDLLGHKVTTLVSEQQRAGAYQVEWNAANMASGIYFYTIKAGEFSQIRKMTLIK